MNDFLPLLFSVIAASLMLAIIGYIRARYVLKLCHYLVTYIYEVDDTHLTRGQFYMAANSDYLGGDLLDLFEEAALQSAEEDGETIEPNIIRIIQVDYLGSSYFTRYLDK